MTKNGLNETLSAINTETNGHNISIGEVVKALQKRGFGPLLIAPALLIVMPTGAIPGVPAICALFILLVAVQLVWGADHPWLPARVRDFSFSRAKFNKAVQKSQPFISYIDRQFRPRLEFLTHRIAQRFIAALCVILSAIIITLGFIPFAPLLPGLAILIFGVGLSVRDGLLTLIGLIVVCACLYLLPSFIGGAGS